MLLNKIFIYPIKLQKLQNNKITIINRRCAIVFPNFNYVQQLTLFQASVLFLRVLTEEINGRSHSIG